MRQCVCVSQAHLEASAWLKWVSLGGLGVWDCRCPYDVALPFPDSLANLLTHIWTHEPPSWITSSSPTHHLLQNVTNALFTRQFVLQRFAAKKRTGGHVWCWQMAPLRLPHTTFNFMHDLSVCELEFTRFFWPPLVPLFWHLLETPGTSAPVSDRAAITTSTSTPTPPSPLFLVPNSSRSPPHCTTVQPQLQTHSCGSAGALWHHRLLLANHLLCLF